MAVFHMANSQEEIEEFDQTCRLGRIFCIQFLLQTITADGESISQSVKCSFFFASKQALREAD